MISFKIFSKRDLCKENIANTPVLGKKLKELLIEYGEGNIAVCFDMPIPAVRIFDGEEYSFLYPYADDARIEGDAIESIAEYAVKEEIGLVFKDVKRDRLSFVSGRFLYSDVRCESFAGDNYSVRIRSEADLVSSIPTVKAGEITLSRLKKHDISEYARLCRDESILEVWGYDYREDAPSAPDEYFYNVQLSEFLRGVSMTFCVRWKKKLIGEASFYAFDYRGGAEIGFRLLPEYRGMGLGRATLLALFAAAEEISLDTLYATVDNKNIPSLSLISQYMDKEREEENITHFILKGEEM